MRFTPDRAVWVRVLESVFQRFRKVSLSYPGIRSKILNLITGLFYSHILNMKRSSGVFNSLDLDGNLWT